MQLKYVLVLLTFLLISSCVEKEMSSKNDLINLRVGWQIPWATQGQLVQVMKHTDVLKKNNLKAQFIGRTYGPLLNELALADSIDVVLTADQPAAVLFSKDKGWIAVGRLMYNRTLTYVPIKSNITSLNQLKNKNIGVPIGAAAERTAVAALAEANLSKEDYNLSNLGIREHMPLIEKYRNDSKWGNFDALSGFDPVPAILEANKLVRPLHVSKVVSLVLMNRKFIEQNPTAPTQFMKALKQSYIYYANNLEQANKWFIDEAKLSKSSQEACNIAASIEPNLKAKSESDIRMGFIEDDFKVMQSAADFVAPKIKKKVNMRDYVSNKYVEGV
jgi:ABC-type nitrate/sulfonate/bicarbonate transport system substrate-binding protein